MKVRATGQPPALPDAQAILAALAQGCTERSCPCAGAARKGKGLTHCPAHEDGTPSLSVTPHTEHGVLLKCHAGCTQAAVIDALRQRGLWPSAATASRRGTSTTQRHVEYGYLGADGGLTATKIRIERPGQKKSFFIEPSGVTVAALPLYRLPELVRADPDVPVLFVEGEKDADQAGADGFVAVTTAGGGGQGDFGTALDALAGRDVILVPDADGVGHGFMRRVRETLAGTARRLRWLDLPGGDGVKGFDYSDWRSAGGTPAELRALMDTAEEASAHGPGCLWCGEAGAAAGGTEPPGLPPFPVDALPEVAGRLVREGAAAVGVPPDAVALPLLAITGGVMGSRYTLRLKRSWSGYAVIWTILVLPPGAAKTPALAVVREAVDVLQKEAHQRWREDLGEYELARASKKDGGPPEGDKPRRPVMETFFSTDATSEAIARVLGDGGSPGMTLIHDEALTFIKGFDVYRNGKGADREKMMSLWSSQPLTIIRKGSDPIYVANPVVSFYGGIQPDVLTAITEDSGRRDGFVERFLIAMPESGPAAWTEDDVSPAAVAALTDTYRQLRAGSGGEVALTPSARATWIAWFNENTSLIAEATGLVCGMYAKLPQQLSRLALVLHCLAYPRQPNTVPLTAGTMAAAIRITEYFRAHGHAVLARFEAAQPVRHAGLQVRIADILRRAGGAWQSTRDLYRALGGNVGADELHGALDALVAGGRVEEAPGEGEGPGRRGQRWRYRAEHDAPRANEQKSKCDTEHESGCICSFCSFARTGEKAEQAPTPAGGAISGNGAGRVYGELRL